MRPGLERELGRAEDGPNRQFLRCVARQALTNTAIRERFGDAAGARVSPDGTGQGGALVRLAVRPFLDEGARSRLEELVGERV